MTSSWKCLRKITYKGENEMKIRNMNIKTIVTSKGYNSRIEIELLNEKNESIGECELSISELRLLSSHLEECMLIEFRSNKD